MSSTPDKNKIKIKTFVSNKIPEHILFQIPSITPSHVSAFIQKLDPRKATGLFGAGPIVLKMATNICWGYLYKHNLIHECQSDFRYKHSRQTALAKLIDQWMSCIDHCDLVTVYYLTQYMKSMQYESISCSSHVSCLIPRPEQQRLLPPEVCGMCRLTFSDVYVGHRLYDFNINKKQKNYE